jgi:DNA processing protein
MTDKFPLAILEHNSISAEQLRQWLALHHAPSFGPIKFLSIAEQHFDPLQLVNSQQKLAATLKLSEKIQQSLKNPDWQSIDADLNWATQTDCHIIPIVSSWYPTLLREIADPPILLYVQGDPELLHFPQIAMVGSRNPSHYGQEAAFEFAKHLSNAGLIITSGMAMGIDSYSHRGAIAATGLTIAVAGTGLDRVYPAKNKPLAEEILRDGTIVSEYPIGTEPVPHNFPRRNRIISGLSLGTLVVEAAVQSGSLITAKQATEQGREVLAIPGSIHSPMARGCHRLIRQGAKLVETGDDILQELGPMISQAKGSLEKQSPKNSLPDSRTVNDGRLTVPTSLTTDQQQLLKCIEFEPVSIDTLVERSRLTPESISSMLVELELGGIIRSSGGLYTRLHE